MLKLIPGFILTCGLMMMPPLAYAQTATSVPSSVAPSSAIPSDTVKDPALAARKMILVKRYLAAIHFDKMMSSMMDAMIPPMVQEQRQSNPNITDAQAKIVTDALKDTMVDFTPKIMDRIAILYADAFSEDELTQIVAFYESPVGQSIITKSTALLAQVGPIMSDIMPGLKDEMVQKICQKMDCGAADMEKAKVRAKAS